MNDSFRSNVFVRFHRETIAAACIYLAAREVKVGGIFVNILSVLSFCKKFFYFYVDLYLIDFVISHEKLCLG